MLKEGGLFLFNVWDRIEESSHALARAPAQALVVEASAI